MASRNSPDRLLSSIMQICHVVLFIVIIELSGVQFCPKSYAWFQNQTSALHEFDFEMKNMISGQNCTKRSSIITLLQPFWNSKLQSLKYSRYTCFIDPVMSWFLESFKSFFSFSCNSFGIFKQDLKFNWLFCFSKAFSLAGEKMRCRAKYGAIRQYIAPIRANRIRITRNFKMDVVNQKTESRQSSKYMFYCYWCYKLKTCVLSIKQ